MKSAPVATANPNVFVEDVEFPVAKLVERLAEKYHLTPRMTEFLLVRGQCFTDREAAAQVKVSIQTVKDWKANVYKFRTTLLHDPDFASAYSELLSKRAEIAGDSLKQLIGKTTLRLNEMLDATTPIYYRGSKVDESPDYDTRFKGAQAVMRALGLWDRPVVDDANSSYKVTMEAFQALLAAKQAQLQVREVPQEAVIEGETVQQRPTSLPQPSNLLDGLPED